VDKLPECAEPLAAYFRLIPVIHLPQRADRATAGIMPTRAFRQGLCAEDRGGFRTTVIRPDTDPHRQRGYGAVESRRRKHKAEP
jgi:hypothetical protein